MGQGTNRFGIQNGAMPLASAMLSFALASEQL